MAYRRPVLDPSSSPFAPPASSSVSTGCCPRQCQGAGWCLTVPCAPGLAPVALTVLSGRKDVTLTPHMGTASYRFREEGLVTTLSCLSCLGTACLSVDTR